MRSLIARHEAWLALAVIVLASLAGAWAIVAAFPSQPADEFNIARWELEHIANKWLYLTDRFFAGGLSEEQGEERLGEYLLLSARIEQIERGIARRDGFVATPAEREELARLGRQRDALENDVEAIIEGRVTSVLDELGLDSSFPLFPDARWVFPPVDFELNEPLRVLVASPRERIVLVEQRPLGQGLTRDEVLARERAAELDGTRSAYVQSVGGAATYPSVVGPRADYLELVETVAHEWTHHYLFFHPLGQHYFDSVELRTLNETVADLVGTEVAALVVERYPLPRDVARQIAAILPEPPVDVGAALRQLRLEVEALLSQGRIDAAEALMEQRRRELAEQGAVFRRLNQAFFAFRNIYADDPASLDPTGQKLMALRAQTGSIAAFLRAAARLTGPAALDRALAER